MTVRLDHVTKKDNACRYSADACESWNVHQGAKLPLNCGKRICLGNKTTFLKKSVSKIPTHWTFKREEYTDRHEIDYDIGNCSCHIVVHASRLHVVEDLHSELWPPEKGHQLEKV
jgi:hypothetical protein